MANEQVVKGKWNQAKGSIKSRWGFLTDDDLTQAEGNSDRLIGKIQEKTGESREKIEHFLHQLLEGGSAKVDQIKDKASAMAADASKQARDFADRANQVAQGQYDKLQDQYGELSSNVRQGYADAELRIRNNPLESITVAFGTGIVAGVILGLCFRPRY